MKKRILGIDPGPVISGYFVLKDGELRERSIVSNHVLEGICFTRLWDLVAIEWIQSYGKIVGRDIFATCLQIGRFTKACDMGKKKKIWKLYPRTKVRAYITGIPNAKDGDVRRALINRFGGPNKGEPLGANGLYEKVTGHAWSALAVAVYANDGAILGGW